MCQSVTQQYIHTIIISSPLTLAADWSFALWYWTEYGASNIAFNNCQCYDSNINPVLGS